MNSRERGLTRDGKSSVWKACAFGIEKFNLPENFRRE